MASSQRSFPSFDKDKFFSNSNNNGNNNSNNNNKENQIIKDLP